MNFNRYIGIDIYSSIQFLDYGRFLSETRYFRDFQHVNQFGAELVSKEMQKFLQYKGE